MKFYQTEARVVAYPDLVDPNPLYMIDMLVGVVGGLRSRRDQQCYPLGGDAGISNTQDLIELSETIGSAAEHPLPNDGDLASYQITGGEIVVEQRSVYFNRFRTNWHVRTDVPSIHIPNFEERIWGPGNQG